VTAHVRPATVSDAKALARLRFEFRSAIGNASEDEGAFIARCQVWMAERLAGDRNWWAWLAVDERGPLGTVWLNRIEKLPNPVDEPESHAYITSLFVQERARGVGIGTQLLAAAIDASVNLDCDAVILWPTPESRSLYERHGFAVREDLMERRGA
jgi:GNAT superfamily N-acetyltransferase